MFKTRVGKQKAAANGASTSSSPRPKPTETIEQYVNNLLESNKVVVFSKSTCPYCAKVKDLFSSLNEPIVAIELDEIRKSKSLRK